MITDLTIRNFRGIKEGKINGLGKVNIFIGKNNSGKSTLLDLLYFIKAPLKPQNELGEYVLESLLQRRIKRNVPTEIEFFHEYRPENTIDFTAKFDEKFELHFTAFSQQRNVVYSYWGSDPENPVAIFSMTVKSPPNIVTRRGSGLPNEPLQFLFQAYSGAAPDDIFAPWIRSEVAQVHLGFISRIVLIDAEFVRKIEKIEDAYWSDILKRRADKQLKNILNETYGLPIESFSFANYRNGQSKLFTMLPEISMHIDDYGDGFRYAFSILTIASQAKSTALLLEEPEVHQHEGALRTLFEALWKLASNNNLQIFISTHNVNVINAWAQLTSDVKIFHLTLGADGKLDVRPIIGSDAKLMMDLGASILRLDEPLSYLILEGKQDQIFLEAISKKINQKSLKDLGYEVVTCPKDEQKTTLPALASTGKPILSCIDYDKTDNIADLVAPFIAPLKNKYKEVEVKDNEVSIQRTGSTITFIPLGLPNDKELSEAGITQYAMEDFIVKLLCVDTNIQKWAGVDLKELRNRAQSFKDKTPLNSSKTIIMTLGVLKEGKTLEELIPAIIEQSDSKLLLEILKPLVAKLFGL